MLSEGRWFEDRLEALLHILSLHPGRVVAILLLLHATEAELSSARVSHLGSSATLPFYKVRISAGRMGKLAASFRHSEGKFFKTRLEQKGLILNATSCFEKGPPGFHQRQHFC